MLIGSDKEPYEIKDGKGTTKSFPALWKEGPNIDDAIKSLIEGKFFDKKFIQLKDKRFFKPMKSSKNIIIHNNRTPEISIGVKTNDILFKLEDMKTGEESTEVFTSTPDAKVMTRLNKNYYISYIRGTITVKGVSEFIVYKGKSEYFKFKLPYEIILETDNMHVDGLGDRTYNNPKSKVSTDFKAFESVSKDPSILDSVQGDVVSFKAGKWEFI